MNTLQFSGDWPPALGIGAALLLAAAAFLLYRRETRTHAHRLSALLPWLRAGAVLLVVLMLTGPVMRHRQTIGTLTRLLVCVDSSLSMGVADPDLELPRKLSIARSLGWLPPAAADPAAEAAEQLAKACSDLSGVLQSRASNDSQIYSAIETFLSRLKEAGPQLDKAGLSQETRLLERECRPALERLRSQTKRPGFNFKQVQPECAKAIEVTRRCEQAAAAKAKNTAGRDAGGDQKVAAVLERLDKTNRSERIHSLLLEGAQDGLLASLTQKFDVQLVALEGARGRTLWSSADGLQTLPTTLPSPEASSSDLQSAILNYVGNAHKSTESDPKSTPQAEQSRTAVLLLSDGQHNAQGSPIELAKQLGDRGIPIFSVGYGNQLPPPDLAVLGVEAPETVFHEDRVRGSVTLKDDMPPGLDYQLRVLCNGKTVWKKTMLSSRRHLLKVPFDVPVKELVQDAQEDPKTMGIHGSLKRNAVPLFFEALVDPLPQEREARNNSAKFLVRATTGKRRILILDGRPRWDSLYVRNLFERDPRWQVNALFGDGTDKSAAWPRGEKSGMFPATEESLLEYDALILGDLPRAYLKDQELEWIANFVSKRGGGLLLMDGQRHALLSYATAGSSPLAQLLPVSLGPRAPQGELAAPQILQLEPTERGRALGAFALNPAAEDATPLLWRSLPPPRWLAPCQALPGTETLLEAVREGSRAPAIVMRQFGAGRVVYMAFDETWRWRQGVAEKYQERFWNQLIPAIAEPLFAAQNESISLDTDAFSYRVGSTADLRARIRSKDGNTPVPQGWRAVLWRDGRRIAAVPLAAEENRKEVLSGRTAPLEAGSYSLGLEGPKGAPESALQVSFQVTTPSDGELGEITLNEDLLARMAGESKGLYLREEHTSKLREALTPLETGRIVETETVLWQSYWWFCAVIALLTLEWILRKRLGLL